MITPSEAFDALNVLYENKIARIAKHSSGELVAYYHNRTTACAFSSLQVDWGPETEYPSKMPELAIEKMRQLLVEMNKKLDELGR